uniref:MULE transposase domain-containing protein n=1 Tax=Rotaria sordida TaxID=392033 RepID=A0A816EFS4_9BILA|nr:unnamed protein product [Rotaria sordida]
MECAHFKSSFLYVLLIGKDIKDYNNFFKQLLLHYDYEPNSVLVDFESATLKSTKAIFSDAIQISCQFHFGQRLWREVQSLGLQIKYTNDDKSRMNVKKLVSLAFVPVTDVLKAYSSIKNDFDYEDYPLLDYFECVSAGQKKEGINNEEKDNSKSSISSHSYQQHHHRPTLKGSE